MDRGNRLGTIEIRILAAIDPHLQESDREVFVCTVRVKIVSVMGDPTSGDRRQPRRSEYDGGTSRRVEDFGHLRRSKDNVCETRQGIRRCIARVDILHRDFRDLHSRVIWNQKKHNTFWEVENGSGRITRAGQLSRDRTTSSKKHSQNVLCASFHSTRYQVRLIYERMKADWIESSHLNHLQLRKGQVQAQPEP
jgi:hypothetical protein